MPAFSDHFSEIATSYAAFRPRYPAALFAWLASVAPDRERVWDCGAGTGQASEGLACCFADVIATDPSVAQLSRTARSAGLHLAVMTAEAVALSQNSVALVTVAQALHWFNHDAFFREVERVLRPRGILAVWSYGLATIDPVIDAIVHPFYNETVGPYWPSERSFVDSGYAGIQLPYAEQSHPPFAMVAEWTQAQLQGYVSTWSAVSRYRQATGDDPIPAFGRALAEAWGSPLTTRTIRWPLTLHVVRKG